MRGFGEPTRTYAELPISAPSYDEIAGKLRTAGYDHAFLGNGVVDLNGIGISRQEPAPDEISAAIAGLRNALPGDDESPDPYWCVDRAALEAAIAALSNVRRAPGPSTEPGRSPGRDQPKPPWREISTIPDSDDLVWLLKWSGGAWAIEGPRAPQVDDVDVWSWWAPCVEPKIRALSPGTDVERKSINLAPRTDAWRRANSQNALEDREREAWAFAETLEREIGDEDCLERLGLLALANSRNRVKALETLVRDAIADLLARAEDGVVPIGSGVWTRLNDSVEGSVKCRKCGTVTRSVDLLDGESCPNCKLVL